MRTIDRNTGAHAPVRVEVCLVDYNSTHTSCLHATDAVRGAHLVWVVISTDPGVASQACRPILAALLRKRKTGCLRLAAARPPLKTGMRSSHWWNSARQL
jgi:hypothetical protein